MRHIIILPINFELITNLWEMDVIDEKQEAVARIRMAIDNDRKARFNLVEEESDTEDESLDLESENSNTWKLGSPDSRGKWMNLRGMANNDPQYRFLDEKLRNFVACNMPEEAVQMRFEDDIYVSLGFQFQRFGNDISSRCKCINVLFSSINQ